MLKTEDVKRVLRDLVAEAGETSFGVEGCYYRNTDGSPLCIVGHVLKRLEPEFFERLGTGQNFAARALNSTGIWSILEPGDALLESEEGARTLLVSAQVEQDSGKTWAYSVKYAEAALAAEEEDARASH